MTPTPPIIRTIDEARAAKPTTTVHCGFCGEGQPWPAKSRHSCPGSEANARLISEGRAAIARRNAEPAECIDCGTQYARNTVHSCPGPKAPPPHFGSVRDMELANIAKGLERLGYTITKDGPQ